MGQEVAQSTFTDAEHAGFRARLRDETRILKRWFDERAFDACSVATGGFEVEAWLLDENCLPAPRNEEFLATVNNDYVVPELSKFNFELNAVPLPIAGSVLSDMREALEALWHRCSQAADSLNMDVLAIGMLPTVRDEMMQPQWMTQSNRYQALNVELMRLRRQQQLHVEIHGRDSLELHATHLMMEAACTSLQVHQKIAANDAVRFYNASLIAAAPLVAAAANAPFLYGRSLWADTRIPTFEQITAAHGFKDAEGNQVLRVTLGTGYLRHSMLELFVENLSYPVLLPVEHDDAGRLPHLRLHNGTIWRWCRPILGFEPSGAPHLRIEQRVMSAGPSIVDMIANMALSFGLTLALGKAEVAPETRLSFAQTRTNFYACARDGLNARVSWGGQDGGVQDLLLNRLVPMARAALAEQGLSRGDLDDYFDSVLHRRLLTGRNGAEWQRSYVDVHGHDLQGMTARYAQLQRRGDPVHTWDV